MHALHNLQLFAQGMAYNVDTPEVPQEWLTLLRSTFDLVEKEMVRMNAALAYAAGYTDLLNADTAQKLRSAREDFLYHGKAFEEDEMWALRSWYWVWKMQGFPDNGYKIMKTRINSNFKIFDKIQQEMWELYGEPSADFTSSERGDAKKRIQAMKAACNAMFEEDANNSTISEAFDIVSDNWREFSLEFVSVSA